MQREVWGYRLMLLLSIPVGVVLGRIMNHPHDPPHVFTLTPLFSGMLIINGIAEERTERKSGYRARCGVSIALFLYIVIVMIGDPFVQISLGTVSGVMEAALFLVPIAAMGVWFARQRLWAQVLAAAIFLMISAALIAYNMRSYSVRGVYREDPDMIRECFRRAP